MNCGNTNPSPYAKCGDSRCEDCYPSSELRSIIKDLFQANEVLKKKTQQTSDLANSVKDLEERLETMSDTLHVLASNRMGNLSDVRKTVSRVIKELRDRQRPLAVGEMTVESPTDTISETAPDDLEDFSHDQ